MTDPLNIPLSQLRDDMSRRNAIIEQVQLAQGVSYPTALERWEGAVAELRGGGTVRTALQDLGVDVEPVDRRLKYLDQADAAVGKVYEDIRLDDDVDELGRAKISDRLEKLLDADNRLTGEAGRVETEKRLKRMRNLDQGYAGDVGRKRFVEEDAAWLAAGCDLVKTTKRAVKRLELDQQASELRRETDADYVERVELEAEVKLLDGQIDELEAKRRKRLDQPAGDGPRMLDASGQARDDIGARVRERMRRLGLPESDYVICLEAEQRGDPMPPEPAAQPAAAPFGVHPAHHDLNARIVKYLDDNNLPDSAYTDTVEGFYSGRIVL